MARQDKDILLKTRPFGFEKKGVMNYIEKIQLENEGLKRQVSDLSVKNNALLKENSMLRAKIDVAAIPQSEEGPEVEVVENYGTQVQTRVTFENLADLDAEPTYELPYETVGRRNNTTTQAVTSSKTPTSKHVVTSKNNVTKKGGKTYISSKK